MELKWVHFEDWIIRNYLQVILVCAPVGALLYLIGLCGTLFNFAPKIVFATSLGLGILISGMGLGAILVRRDGVSKAESLRNTDPTMRNICNLLSLRAYELNHDRRRVVNQVLLEMLSRMPDLSLANIPHPVLGCAFTPLWQQWRDESDDAIALFAIGLLNNLNSKRPLPLAVRLSRTTTNVELKLALTKYIESLK